MKQKKGTVYWITGLSGAGKTTIGTALYKRLSIDMDNLVILDGDAIRKAFDYDIGYTREDRHKGAKRNSQLSKLLSEQGINVICCTIGMFHDVREWNRENIENYVEIFLRVPLDVLQKRDQKGLYSGYEAGSVIDVVGVDLELEFPRNPDIIIDNTGEYSVESIVDRIMAYKG